MPEHVVITGASRGIGRAVAEKLLADERLAIHNLSRTPSNLQRVDDVACDLADPEAVGRAAGRLLQACGVVDVLILNAAIGRFAAAHELTIADWHETLAVDLTAPFILLNRFLPSMRSRGRGRIVVVTSDADHLSFPGASAYCAAKAGLAQVAACVRKETAGFDITVTTVSTGRVDTYFNNKQPGDRPDSLRAGDVASAVAFAVQQPAGAELERIELNSTREKMLH